MIDKSLPANIEAECATLGSILLNREAIITVAPWLQSHDFYLAKHACIYDAMLACYNAHIPTDVRTVHEQLRKAGTLEQIGGFAYLSELTDNVPTAYHVEYYGRTVEQTAVYRRLIEAGGKIAAIGYDEADDADTAVSAAQSVLTAVAQRAGTIDMLPVSSVVDELYTDFSSDAAPGKSTGFRDYDEITGGLHTGDFVIVAARPGVGKSSLATSIALNMAQVGERVQIFSLEMTRKQVVQRLVSMVSGVNVAVIRDRKFRDDELACCYEALGQIQSLPIYIDETPALPIQQLRAKALRHLNEYGPAALIIVDYIQLVRAPGQKDEYHTVSEVSRTLKALGKEAKAPILGLAQLSRAVEGRSSHVPMLSDLRESGQLEQDADQVVFIYREEMYEKETDKKGVAELHIAKHRNGACGVIPMRFDAATTQFQTLSYRSPEGY